MRPRPLYHRLENFGATLLLEGFRVLPFAFASSVGAWIARSFGPRLGVSKIARKNLTHIFPHLDSSKVDKILYKMWENLGRLPAEYLHPYDLENPGIVTLHIQGEEVLKELKASGRPCLFLSGHFGNWQLATLVARRFGLEMSMFYRPVNNPLFEKYYRGMLLNFVDELIPKSSHSLKVLLQSLKQGRQVMMLFDQRMDKGDVLSFLGYPAHTTSIIPRLGEKTGCGLVFFYVVREGPCEFRVHFDPPVTASGDAQGLSAHFNSRLEDCIRAHPEQWFWLHDRWKKV